MNIGEGPCVQISRLSMTARPSRRRLLVGAGRFAAGGALIAAFGSRQLLDAAAQGTPAPAASLPELTVTVVEDSATGQAFHASLTEIPAGYVLLTAINQSARESSVGFVGPRPGQSMQDMLQLASTPEAGTGFPTFFTQASVPGGTYVPAGATAQVVVELAAGDWALWGGGETDSPPPVFITATASESNQSEPSSSITVTEVDFAFSGLDASIPPGKQTWKVVNTGTQPHMLSLSLVPAGTTVPQVLAMFNEAPDATPEANALTRSDFNDIGGVLLQSPNTTTWPTFELAAGHYCALCFMTDPSNGEPHAMEGMIAIFDVA